MKKLWVCFLLFSSAYSSAQQWDSLGGGLSGIPPFDGVDALTIYNGNLYAGGSILYIDSTLCIGYWNGSNWKRVGYGIALYPPPCGSCLVYVPAVYALTEYRGNLFAGGFFDDTMSNGNAYYSIVQWNKSAWDSVSSGLPGAYNPNNYLNDAAYCLAVYQNTLYMGGSFKYTKTGTQVNNLTKWAGGQWEPVTSGMNGGVYALAVYNNNLYVGGGFTLAGGVHVSNIAMWNGTHWSSVSNGINGIVEALYVSGGKLYAGGSFDSAGGQRANDIACWNDTAWAPLGKGIALTNQGNGNYGVYALTNYGPDLCAGGIFDTAGSVRANNIALWDGLTWSSLGSGVNGSVEAVIEYNGALIAGGYFDTAGGISAINIAQWKSPLGINSLSSANETIKVYPNPGNGLFTVALSHVELVSTSQSIIEIYNIWGQQVQHETLKQSRYLSGQGDYTINLSNQPDGVYLYRVLSDTGYLLGEGKLIIQK